MTTKHTTTKPSACSDRTETDPRESLEGILKKVESAQDGALRMGKIACGVQAIGDVLEYAANNKDGTSAFGTSFDNNVAQLLEALGEYGQSIVYGDSGAQGLFTDLGDLYMQIDRMKGTKAGDR